jgi:ribonuclease R
MREHFLAQLQRGPEGQLVAVDFISGADGNSEDPPRFEGEGNAGDLIEVRLEAGVARAISPDSTPVARAGSSLARMYAIAAKHGMDPIFGPEVERELAPIVRSPGFDDPDLVDLRPLAFVTIDNRDSRDLDQAMFIERRGGGFRVVYALADAAHYLRPGTALFHAALARGATYYFPGFCVPMLPRVLSEDLVSLNPGVDRRALVFDIELDASGDVVNTQMYRALIHSRAKLSYPGVQELHDHWEAGNGDTHELDGDDFTSTLRLLRVVGELRMRLAFERDVVRYRRRELLVHAGPEGTSFTVVEADRNDVERWNEQISLLCNSEGARLMVEAGAQPNLQAIFRVHAPPHHRRVKSLATLIARLVEARQLDPELWRWKRSEGESLAEFLDRLPATGPQSRRSKAIQRLALVINNRSEFSDEAGVHHGVGAAAYARFSSPMRELVGVFTHKEAIEWLVGRAGETPPARDLELQERIIDLANESKRRQTSVTKEANKVAITAVLQPQLALPLDERPWHAGTLMGASPRVAYVQLDDTPMELKVYFSDLDDRGGRPRYRKDEIGVDLPEGGALIFGDAVRVRLLGENESRFVLALEAG